ncbi:MAG: hypothetical protein IKZ98_09280 [Clostridia bacterium]|nr:hypothetical protein [Clostridia bacterium]
MEIKKQAAPKKVQEVKKPFLTGSILDENTFKNSAKFLGMFLVIVFVAFIACSSAAFGSDILRIGLNAAVVVVVMMLMFNFGSNHGAEAVSHGEILWQRREKGLSFSDSEQRLCFHPMKGYVVGLLGSNLILVPAIILACSTTIQTTDSGALPSWMQAYLRRGEISNALINYTQPEGMGFVDYLRAFVRICIIPFVNLVGHSNKAGMLTLERICPLILLLPAVAYGTGYISGKSVRTKIHTAISENEKKRIRRDNKKRRNQSRPVRSREPEQLN